MQNIFSEAQASFTGPNHSKVFMSEKRHLHRSDISRLESGTRTPTLETLQRAAAALGVPLEIRFGSQVIALSRGK